MKLMKVSPAKPKVLIVDNNKSTLEMLHQQVSSRYEVVSARNYSEVVTVMLENNFAAALIDIRLDYASGLVLANRLSVIYPDMVIIIMSSKANHLRDLNPVFVDYVYKYDDNDSNMVDVIANAIYNKKMSEETRARRDSIMSPILAYKNMISDIFYSIGRQDGGGVVKFCGRLITGEEMAWSDYQLWQHKNFSTSALASSVGCIGGCTFCAWGKVPFKRNLSCREYCCQFFWTMHSLLARGIFEKNPTMDPYVNLTGTGEPLINWSEVIQFFNILHGMFGSRCGYVVTSICREKDLRNMVDSLRSLEIDLSRFRLYFSLNFSDPRMRGKMMRATEGENLPAIYKLLLEVYEITGNKPTVSIAQMHGVNDTDKDAMRIARDWPGLLYKTQPFARSAGFERFRTASPEQVRDFIEKLVYFGLDEEAIRGREVICADIKGGCGSCESDRSC